MLARSRVLQTTLGQFLNSVGSLLFTEKRTSCSCRAAQWPPSSGRARTDRNLEVLLSDKAERHGSNYKANIYRNVKTCVFSLHPLSSSSFPFSAPSLSECRKARHLCEHTSWHTLSAAVPVILDDFPVEWNWLQLSVCPFEKGIISLSFFIPGKVGNGLGIKVALLKINCNINMHVIQFCFSYLTEKGTQHLEM